VSEIGVLKPFQFGPCITIAEKATPRGSKGGSLAKYKEGQLVLVFSLQSINRFHCKMANASIFSLVDEIKKETTQDSLYPGHSHARLLQLVDELKLTVETPTETILRLIYQVKFSCKSTPRREWQY
jgi:hypothetical protein